VHELDAGESLAFGDLLATATPALHGGFRPPFGPTTASLGYLLEDGRRRVYFAGDTDLFPGMADLGELDVALLPIWGWGPRLGPGHLDPYRAAEALRLLRPRTAVPIHWGTYWLRGAGRVLWRRLVNPPHEFAAYAAVSAPEVVVRAALPGEPLVRMR
jgi:L-ascorbate metabolism protein UlaG (beta-lactamase superfamily)